MRKIDIRTGTFDAKCGICRMYEAPFTNLKGIAGRCQHSKRKPSYMHQYSNQVFSVEVCGYFKTCNVAKRRGA
jgi:hypothetical protein